MLQQVANNSGIYGAIITVVWHKSLGLIVKPRLRKATEIIMRPDTSGYWYVVWELELRLCYLLVLPAVRDKDVVPHLHTEVQPGQSVTHPHPYRRSVAGHCCHGSHFLFVSTASDPLLHPAGGKTQGSEEPWCERRTGEKGKAKERWRFPSRCYSWTRQEKRSLRTEG